MRSLVKGLAVFNLFIRLPWMWERKWHRHIKKSVCRRGSRVGVQYCVRAGGWKKKKRLNNLSSPTILGLRRWFLQVTFICAANCAYIITCDCIMSIFPHTTLHGPKKGSRSIGGKGRNDYQINQAILRVSSPHDQLLVWLSPKTW